MYRLEFDSRAKKEFDELGAARRRRFQAKLAERLGNPRIEAGRLSGLPECDKIKMRSDGYRMIYRVEDDVIVVFGIAAGRRDSSRHDVYDAAQSRLRL